MLSRLTLGGPTVCRIQAAAARRRRGRESVPRRDSDLMSAVRARQVPVPALSSETVHVRSSSLRVAVARTSQSAWAAGARLPALNRDPAAMASAAGSIAAWRVARVVRLSPQLSTPPYDRLGPGLLPGHSSVPRPTLRPSRRSPDVSTPSIT